MNDGFHRQPHAVLDLPSRGQKAEKIAMLTGIRRMSSPVSLLEVGTGSGGIAHYFAHLPGIKVDVDAVDVVDSRLLHDGYRFTKVDDVLLPFGDDSFDVVISNHVIEHVGDRAQQVSHLRELRRVLKPGGIVYLAVPNRWMLVEPHYRLRFLSWLPHRLRTPYLRLRGRGDYYDCEPLERRELEELAREAGLSYRNISVSGFRATLAIEGDKGPLARILHAMPDRVLSTLESAIPTHIYLLAHGEARLATRVGVRGAVVDVDL